MRGKSEAAMREFAGVSRHGRILDVGEQACHICAGCAKRALLDLSIREQQYRSMTVARFAVSFDKKLASEVRGRT